MSSALKTRWPVLLILAAVGAVYYPALSAGFVNFDDPAYLLNNPGLAFTWANVKGAFLSFQVSNYHPLTMLSYMAEYSAAGLNPAVFHLTSVLLHAANSLLVLALARALGRSGEEGVLAALLFAIHPLHAESAAWISERKDVLCAFFYLSALIVYAGYVKKGGGPRLAACFALALLALLSKSMAVTLPLALLLADHLLARRPSPAALAEKLPFFALSLVFAALALKSQGRLGPAAPYPYAWWEHIVIACRNLVFYCWKTAWPADLSAFYPFPVPLNGRLPLSYYLAVPAAGLYLYALKAAAARSRLAFFGGAFFLAALLPVLQLVPVGSAVAADRYTYLPSAGLFLLAAAAFFRLRGRAEAAASRLPLLLLYPAAFFALFTLGLLGWARARLWNNSLALWNDAFSKYPSSVFVLRNRGVSLLDAGRYAEALEDFSRAVALYPGYAENWDERGSALFLLGRYDDGVQAYTKALELDPALPGARSNRSQAYKALGRKEAAAADFAALRQGRAPRPE